MFGIYHYQKNALAQNTFLSDTIRLKKPIILFNNVNDSKNLNVLTFKKGMFANVNPSASAPSLSPVETVSFNFQVGFFLTCGLLSSAPLSPPSPPRLPLPPLYLSTFKVVNSFGL